MDWYKENGMMAEEEIRVFDDFAGKGTIILNNNNKKSNEVEIEKKRKGKPKLRSSR